MGPTELSKVFTFRPINFTSPLIFITSYLAGKAAMLNQVLTAGETDFINL